MEEINYAEKIQNFKLLIENDDDDIAFNYLSNNDWNEENAAIAFNAENRTIQSNSQLGRIESPLNSPGQSVIYRNPIEESQSLQNQQPPVILQEIGILLPREPGFFEGGLFNIFGGLWTPKEVSDEDCFKIFEPLNISTKTYKNFTLYSRTRVGVLIIYSKGVLAKMRQLVEQITKNHLSLEIISKAEVYPMLMNTEEGKILTKQLDVKVYPSVFICKPIKNNTALAILGRLEREITHESLIKFIQDGTIAYQRLNKTKPQPQQQLPFDYVNVNSPNNVNNNQFISNNPSQNISSMTDDELAKYIQSQEYNQGQEQLYQTGSPLMSNADLIQQQKRDLEELERKEQAKKAEERRLEELRRNELKKQEELKQKELLEKKKIEEQLKKKKAQLPPEPEDTDSNKTKILFRYPDGERNKERKFLKTHTIQVLYDFIDTLGQEIYTEPEVTQYELIQTFPFKRYENKSNTLEQEGLCPNAVIQIREIEKQ